MVDNRNAISHGRLTPEEVGGRYSWQEVASRVDDTNAIAGHVVSSLESHVQSGGLFAAAPHQADRRDQFSWIVKPAVGIVDDAALRLIFS